MLDDLAAMTKLQEVSTRLVQTSDPAALLLEIVDAAIAVTGADMGNIQLLDHASDRLRIVASRGFDGPFLEFFDTVQEATPAAGWRWRPASGSVSKTSTTARCFATVRPSTCCTPRASCSLQATPLFDRSGRVVGVLSTHDRVPRRLADRDRRLVDLLARQAADLIERANAEQALLEADRAKDEFLAMSSRAAQPAWRDRQRRGGAQPRCRPAAALARDTDGAGVELRQLLHQGEPDARALVGPRSRAQHPMKALEDVGQLIVGNPDARVANRQLHFDRRPARSDTAISPSNVNLNAFESRLRTIFSHISRST